MKIDLLLTSHEVPDAYTKGRRVVVVDVLRACTSLTVALDSGAEQIVPADSVEGAKQLLGFLDRKTTVLAGEKDGAKLPGFDLGNSPREFRDPRVAGRTILFASTNGAPLMARISDAAEKPLLSFVNIGAVAAYIQAGGEDDLTVLCAGKGGRFSMEDAVCGGMLCHLLAQRGNEPELNDGARAALILYQAHKDDLPGMIQRSSAGNFLRSIGMEADLDEAVRVDSVNLVPVVRDGRVTALRPPWPGGGSEA